MEWLDVQALPWSQFSPRGAGGMFPNFQARGRLGVFRKWRSQLVDQQSCRSGHGDVEVSSDVKAVAAAAAG